MYSLSYFMIWSLATFQSLFRNFPEGVSQVGSLVTIVSNGFRVEGDTHAYDESVSSFLAPPLTPVRPFDRLTIK